MTMQLREYLQRALVLVLGYDFFISYRRSEAGAYAEALARELGRRKFTCFVDRNETEGGVDLKPALAHAVRRSRTMVVIATPGIVASDWVAQEIALFRSRGRRKTLIPINVDRFLAAGVVDKAPFSTLREISWLDETGQAVAAGVPSPDCVEQIARSHRRMKVRNIAALLLILVALAVVGLGGSSIPTILDGRRQAADAYASIRIDVERTTEILRCLLFAAREQRRETPLSIPSAIQLNELEQSAILAELEGLDFADLRLGRPVIGLAACRPGDSRLVVTIAASEAQSIAQDLERVRSRNLGYVDGAVQDLLGQVARHPFLTGLADADQAMRRLHSLEDSDIYPYRLLGSPGVSRRQDFVDFLAKMSRLSELTAE